MHSDFDSDTFKTTRFTLTLKTLDKNYLKAL